MESRRLPPRRVREVNLGLGPNEEEESKGDLSTQVCKELWASENKHIHTRQDPQTIHSFWSPEHGLNAYDGRV